jgi:hypothetical protein
MNVSVICGFEATGAGLASVQSYLRQAESEIHNRGHETFRLRIVKSNIRALQFHKSQGWKVHHEFPHENFGHAMFEITKSDRPI